VRAAAVLFLLGLATAASAQEAAPEPVPAATPAPARAPGRVRVTVLGGFGLGSASFDETRTFTEFAEEGRIDSRYEQDPGPGFEAGVAWRFSRRLAVSAALALARRSEAGSFSAALPHPLFFGAPRQAGGEFSGRTHRETALHLDLALVGGAGRLQWTALAGPSVIGVDTDLVRAVDYTHAYPYDTVTVTGTPFASVSGSALGFNLGAGLAWQAARHVAIQAQLRFARAQVTLSPAPGDEVEVSAGGTAVAVGLRLDF
jgi:opacity protein-like surface antigen